MADESASAEAATIEHDVLTYTERLFQLLATALLDAPMEEAFDRLTRLALVDPEPLVRAHAAWALGRVGSAEARSALSAHTSVETDACMLEELSRGYRVHHW